MSVSEWSFCNLNGQAKVMFCLSSYFMGPRAGLLYLAVLVSGGFECVLGSNRGWGAQGGSPHFVFIESLGN